MGGCSFFGGVRRACQLILAYLARCTAAKEKRNKSRVQSPPFTPLGNKRNGKESIVQVYLFSLVTIWIFMEYVGKVCRIIKAWKLCKTT